MGEIMWELYWIFDIPQQNSNGFPLFGSHSLRKTNESNFPVSSRFWDFVRRKNASKSSTTRLNIEPISGCLIHHHPPLPAAPPLHVVQCPWTTPTPLLGGHRQWRCSDETPTFSTMCDYSVRVELTIELQWLVNEILSNMFDCLLCLCLYSTGFWRDGNFWSSGMGLGFALTYLEYITLW